MYLFVLYIDLALLLVCLFVFFNMQRNGIYFALASARVFVLHSGQGQVLHEDKGIQLEKKNGGINRSCQTCDLYLEHETESASYDSSLSPNR